MIHRVQCPVGLWGSDVIMILLWETKEEVWTKKVARG